MNDNNIWLEYTKDIKKIKNYKKKIAASIKINASNELSNPQGHPSTVIDLHGMTQNQAFEALKNFLKNSYKYNKRELLVITGKGKPDKPGIIKLEVPRWLQYTELKEYILEYSIASDRLGGEGAILIKLKKNKGELRDD